MQPAGRQVAGEPLDELEPAELSAYRVDRDASGAECFDVAQHRALRHLKLGGEL